MPELCPVRSHCLAVLVANEPGALARIIGLFSGRGYNIESLTVAEVDKAHSLSRVTIVTHGTDATVAQIMAQLGRLVPVRRVVDMGADHARVERDLALVKVAARDPAVRAEAIKVAVACGGRAADANAHPLVLELVATPAEVDAALDRLARLGMTEIARAGTVVLAAGEDTL